MGGHGDLFSRLSLTGHRSLRSPPQIISRHPGKGTENHASENHHRLKPTSCSAWFRCRCRSSEAIVTGLKRDPCNQHRIPFQGTEILLNFEKAEGSMVTVLHGPFFEFRDPGHLIFLPAGQERIVVKQRFMGQIILGMDEGLFPERGVGER